MHSVCSMMRQTCAANRTKTVLIKCEPLIKGMLTHFHVENIRPSEVQQGTEELIMRNQPAHSVKPFWDQIYTMQLRIKIMKNHIGETKDRILL